MVIKDIITSIKSDKSFSIQISFIIVNTTTAQ